MEKITTPDIINFLWLIITAFLVGVDIGWRIGVARFKRLLKKSK